MTPFLKSKIALHITVSLALCGLTVFLGYCVQRSDFWVFFGAYAAFFGLYGWVISQVTRADTAAQQHISRYYTVLGIALRVMLLFHLPLLSDDIYRFIWDGRLTAAGIHPFAHPPTWFMENQVFPPGITPELYTLLNSPRYFTVYPPVCQAVFAATAWLAPTSIWGGMLVIKLLLLACEIGTIKLMPKFTLHCPLLTAHSSLLYALNPLLILEVVGNCHFEGAMIFFLMAGLWMLCESSEAVTQSHRLTIPLSVIGAAVLWALAVASKLVPLMFLPLVWRWLGWRRGAVFVAVFGLASVLLFAPLLSPEVLANMGRSLDLYFQKFQFNASLYYLLRAVGLWQTGFDKGSIIGPWLGVVVAAGVLGLAFFRLKTHDKLERLVEALLFATLLQLTCAATVHAWYVTVPLTLSLLTRWWRFGLVWSGAVALSYSHYASGLFQENYWLIAVEYALVWLALSWDVLRFKSYTS